MAAHGSVNQQRGDVMKDKICNKLKACVWIVAILFICVGTSKVMAQEQVLGTFDPKVTYDVYCSIGGDQVSVIKNVKVLDPVSIQGGSVLVIVTAGLRQEKGYVQMKNVIAILPAGQVVESKYKFLSENN
jgi:hypothetical protein